MKIGNDTASTLAANARELAAASTVVSDTDPAALDVGALAPELKRLRTMVRDDEGLVILRGLPAAALDAHEYTTPVWCLAAHFGNSISQNAAGERVSGVVDSSRSDATSRAYRWAQSLRHGRALPVCVKA